ncbi:MAG: tetratricopeptide repeat protein, partial [Myxococcota bacterium]
HAALGLYLESAPGKGDPVPALTRALELDPNHTEAQLWLANAMPASKESFARLERLVDQDPAFIPAVSNLTNFYTQRAEFDRARAILTRAASVPGMKARVAPQQASLEIAAGELAKAYELAKSAYEREPGNMGAKATLGFALMMLGEFEESARVGILVNQVASAWAANTLGEAIRLVEAQPPTRSLADLVPSIYVEAGRYQDAVNYFEAVFGEDVALKDLNGLGSSVASLAYAYRKIGDTERSEQLIELARTVVRKGRALGYSNLPSRQVFIAEVEGAAGNIEAARSEISSAIKNGLVGAIAKSPVLEKVFPRSEMAPGIDVIFERTNAQRAKLGWPPIEPPRPEG